MTEVSHRVLATIRQQFAELNVIAELAFNQSFDNWLRTLNRPLL
jgi:hypothetical protein